MRQLISALMKEGVVSIVLLVILCLLVWFGGEYLETPTRTRIGIICVLLGLWGSMFILQKVRAVKGAMRIEKQLKAQSGAQLAGAAADKKAEIAELRKKFDDSLDALKRSKGGKSALFTLPWYVIIGPPGSGKTTALQESGLNFPASQGNAKVKGIGGTRNCDWWFTDEGILLDTAGRYTTVAEDQEEWLAFLSMIKAGRKQKPINGAIVAVGMDELLRGTPDDIDRIAKDVRNRLDELSARLQAVFPVYVMFTKCDLLPGFAEFFEDFTKDERSQVWGMTFPYQVPDKQYAEIFDEESRRLHESLMPRRLQLLATERPAQKKQNIYLFPSQYALALPRMKDLVGSLFGATAFQESAILRGIYFSSGTQKGAPIDQLMARMGAALGVEASAGADERLEKKSFFINHLFTQIMFPDKLLARSTSAVLRKRKIARGLVQFASVLVLALASYALINSFLSNKDLIAEAETAAAGLKDAGDNPAKELEQLRALEAMRHQLQPLEEYDRVGGLEITRRMGMYQGDKMLKAGIQPYMARLRPMFVDPCTRRIESRLNVLRNEAAKERKSEVYQQMLDLWRVYRMIGNDNLSPQPALIAAVLSKNQLWTGNIDGPDNAEVTVLANKQLEFYAQLVGRAATSTDGTPADWKELYEGWFAKIDTVLVQTVMNQLGAALWEDLAYEAIIRRASEKLEPLGLAAMLAGDKNAGMLEVRSTEGAEDPQKLINALTQDAWDGQMKPLIEERARDLAKQLAELGMKTTEEEKTKALRELHKRRHAQEWKRFLSSIYPRKAEFSSLNEARGAMRDLAGDASPYIILFDRAWTRRELNMGPGESLGKATDSERKAVADSIKALKELGTALDTFVAATSNGRVKNHLQNTAHLTALADAITNTANGIRRAFPSGADGAAGADVMLRVVEAVVEALRSVAVAELEAVWNGDGKGAGVADFWVAQCAGRYPFDASQMNLKDSALDAKLDQVSVLLNPKNGKLWEAHRLISAVQSLKFDGRPLFVFKADYDDAIRNATALTEALFDTKEDERIKVRFGITLAHRNKLHSSSFQCGVAQPGQPSAGQANILRYNENPQNAKDFTWEQLDTARFQPGAKIGARWIDANIEDGEELDFLGHSWGLFKLMQQIAIMGPAKDSEGKDYYGSYRFVADSKAVFVLDVYLTAAKSVNPFAPEVFTKLKIAKGFAQ